MTYLELARSRRRATPPPVPASRVVTAEAVVAHPCVSCEAEAGSDAIWCPPCWQVRQRRGRVLPFDLDRRARAVARETARPCATCGGTVVHFNARGDAACSSCFPPSEASR